MLNSMSDKKYYKDKTFLLPELQRAFYLRITKKKAGCTPMYTVRTLLIYFVYTFSIQKTPTKIYKKRNSCFLYVQLTDTN